MRKPHTDYPYALNTRGSLSANIFCVNYPQDSKNGDNRKGMGHTTESCYMDNQLHFLLKVTAQATEMQGLRGTVSEMSTVIIKEK